VTPGQPLGYADLDTVQRTLRLVPPPAASGILELLYIQVPPNVTAVAPGADLPFADEFASAIKYVTLGVLLRKVGRLMDPERASYCDRRYELAQTVTSIILEGWS
jgi:hypothetical protein